MSLLTDHLNEVGETYFEHLAKAVGFAAKMLTVAGIFLVHAVLPFLFVRTGSDRVGRLYEAMVRRQGQVNEETVAPHSASPLEKQGNGDATGP